jgi:hypothetical protein
MPVNRTTGGDGGSRWQPSLWLLIFPSGRRRPGAWLGRFTIGIGPGRQGLPSQPRTDAMPAMSGNARRRGFRFRRLPVKMVGETEPTSPYVRDECDSERTAAGRNAGSRHRTMAMSPRRAFLRFAVAVAMAKVQRHFEIVHIRHSGAAGHHPQRRDEQHEDRDPSKNAPDRHAAMLSPQGARHKDLSRVVLIFRRGHTHCRCFVRNDGGLLCPGEPLTHVRLRLPLVPLPRASSGRIENDGWQSAVHASIRRAKPLRGCLALPSVRPLRGSPLPRILSQKR